MLRLQRILVNRGTHIRCLVGRADDDENCDANKAKTREVAGDDEHSEEWWLREAQRRAGISLAKQLGQQKRSASFRRHFDALENDFESNNNNNAAQNNASQKVAKSRYHDDVDDLDDDVDVGELLARNERLINEALRREEYQWSTGDGVTSTSLSSSSSSSPSSSSSSSSFSSNSQDFVVNRFNSGFDPSGQEDEFGPADNEDDVDGDNDNEDAGVLLEGLPLLREEREWERRETVSVAQITALGHAIVVASVFQQRVADELANLDDWSCDVRFLPPYYRERLDGAFFFELDKPLLGRDMPDVWKVELLDRWLCDALGWQRVAEPNRADESAPMTFGYLRLPLDALTSLRGADIGEQPEPTSDPTPVWVARGIAYRYVSSERVHRAVRFQPRNEFDSPCAPATAWVREPAWQQDVLLNFFGADHLGYDVAFNPREEEVQIRATDAAMQDAVQRALAIVAAAQLAANDDASDDDDAGSENASAATAVRAPGTIDSRNLSALCSQQLWADSRVRYWMKLVKSHARRSCGAQPMVLADGTTVFAIDLGRIDADWQRALATEWLGAQLGWRLLLSAPDAPSYAYFEIDLLLSANEFFASYPERLKPGFACVTPHRVGHVTVQRELGDDVRALAHYVSQPLGGVSSSDSSSSAALQPRFVFRTPTKRWMRPIVEAYFERFLGYELRWRSGRRAVIKPSNQTLSQAVHLLVPSTRE
jgi:hypothetical protein